MDISSDKIMSKVDEHLEAIAFLYQLTEKDIAYVQRQGLWDNYKLDEKLKVIANIIGGRTVGYNAFPNYGKYAATFNLGNAINKTSELGLGLWAAAELGFLSAKWSTRGKKIATGGAIGGIFDAPVSSIQGGGSQTAGVSGSSVLSMGIVR